MLKRFNSDLTLKARIESLLERQQDLLDLNQYERPEQPEHVDPQHTLRAYMDDQ